MINEKIYFKNSTLLLMLSFLLQLTSIFGIENIVTKKSVSKYIELTVPPIWSVVPEDKNYHSRDVIIACLTITDSRFESPLPANPEKEDCTKTFQEGLDQVYAAGGGTLFVPEGKYLIKGDLIIPTLVTLRGRWAPPSKKSWKTGTVLLIAPDEVKESGATISLEDRSGLCDLNFYYPNQKENKIIPYKFTIDAYNTENTIENLTLVNSYRGIDAQKAAMTVLRNIYGTAIHTGVIAGWGKAFPRIEVICLSPDYWEMWPLDNAVARPIEPGNYAHSMFTEGIGFRLREMDGCNFFHGEISGYSIGLVTEDDAGEAKSEPEAPHGEAIGLKIINCRTALKIRLGGMNYFESVFEGTEYGIESTEAGLVNKFVDSHIAGGISAVSLKKSSTSKLRFENCEIKGGIWAQGKNQIQLTDSDIKVKSGKAIDFGNDVTGFVNGTTINGKVYNEKAAPNMSVLPKRLNVGADPKHDVDFRNDMNLTFKPKKSDLFNVKDEKFAGGAKGDKKSDDSKAIQMAISAAKENGGGIVFFPPGFYKVTENLNLGEGIELRGAAGSRWSPGLRDVIPSDRLLSVIYVEAEGKAEGTPFIQLGNGSGVRGLLFFYPGNNFKRLMVDNEGFKEYPFTISAQGKNNYIINCPAVNPYQYIDFNGAQKFFSEYCLSGGIKTVYRVHGNSKNGRIQTGHIKPSGFFGSLADRPNDHNKYRNEYGFYTAKMLTGFSLSNCSDITIIGMFVRTANRIMNIHNASGKAIMVGGEHLQNGFVFERTGKKPFYLIHPHYNGGRHGDETGKHAILLTENYKSTAWVYSPAFAGAPDQTYCVLSGKLVVNRGSTPGFGYRTARSVYVGKDALFELNQSEISRDWTLSIEPSGKALLNHCEFDGGIPVVKDPTTLIINNCTSPGRSIISSPSHLQESENGLSLDIRGTERVKHDTGWGRKLKNTNTFRLDVTEPTFMDGKAKICDIRILLSTKANCKIRVLYKTKEGMRNAKSSLMFQGSGFDDKLSYEDYINLNSKGFDGFHFINVYARDTYFNSVGDDIIIEFIDENLDKAEPMLAIVRVTSLEK